MGMQTNIAVYEPGELATAFRRGEKEGPPVTGSKNA